MEVRQPRKYNSHTTQCNYTGRNGTRCTRNARSEFCNLHKPKIMAAKRQRAIEYQKSKIKNTPQAPEAE